MTAALEVTGLERVFSGSAGKVRALGGVDFRIEPGELVALAGRSGSGKTTLLNCLGGLDSPTAGSIRIGDDELTTMTEDERTRLRRDRVAFVFQTFGLVPMITAAENVGLPMRLRRTPSGEREERVADLLARVGLSGHGAQRPAELSGGQQQRVAIARALANSPELLIADEPTGQLDAETGARIMALLRDVVRSDGMTALVATHDPVLISMADRVLRLADGVIVAD